MQIPIVRLALGDAEVEAAGRVIRSGWVAQGPEVAAFERELAAAVGAPFAVAVSNCTVALELSLRVAGVQPGDDVATVSHSFIATANAVVALGARPIFVDVQPDTYCMDPAALVRAITPRTRAILCVHQIGFPCDLPAILAVARPLGLPVIEDAACAIGSEIRIDGNWQRIGRPHGLLACFSFHPRKLITTGDGGAITTSDPSLAERLRLLRQHAMSLIWDSQRVPSPPAMGSGEQSPPLPTRLPSTARHDSHQVTLESFSEPAFNFRMTDLQAAVGRPQLARLPAIIAERRALAARYTEALADHPLLAPPSEPAWVRSNWQSYPTTLRPGGRMAQVEIMQFLLDRGVASRRGIGNAHAEPAYAKCAWSCGPEPCDPAAHAAGRCLRLPVSERARDNTILLPLFHGMSPAEQEYVVASLRALPG
jgi:Predicted pyridoxal phosphate-dependent enzyme apparently involved in regulation of cell wall biogenesis